MEKTNNGQLLAVDTFEIYQGESPTVCGSNEKRRHEVYIPNIAKYALLLFTQTTNPPPSSCQSTILNLVT